MRSFVFRALVFLVASLTACVARCGGEGVTDLDGRPSDPLAADTKVTVLFFVSIDCPVSNRYAPEIHRLYERFGSRGVVFRLVYPTLEESPSMIREHIREYGFPFAALRDPRHTLVALAKASVTPESAVFAHGELVYHGRIDDRQVDFGEALPEPRRRDLEDAIEAVVAGRRPVETEAPAIGCAISRKR